MNKQSMTVPWLNCTDEFEELYDDDWKTTFSILMVVIAVLAVFENGIIIVVFYKNPVIRTSTNVILLALAVADFLTGLVVAPIYAILLLNDRLVGDCQFYVVQKYFALAFMGASAFIVALVAFDRLQSITKLQNYKMGRTRLYRLLFVCWTIPSLLSLFGLINEYVYSIVVFSVGVFVIIVVVLSYVTLLNTIRKHRQTLTDDLSVGLIKNEQKAWRTVLIIITCYFVMLCPALIDKMLYFAGSFDGTEGRIDRSKFVIFSKFLCAGNSVVNPLIYGCRTHSIRTQVLKLVGVREDGHCPAMGSDRRRRRTSTLSRFLT